MALVMAIQERKPQLLQQFQDRLTVASIEIPAHSPRQALGHYGASLALPDLPASHTHPARRATSIEIATARFQPTPTGLSRACPVDTHRPPPPVERRRRQLDPADP
jgi:hypothetical protein